MRLEMLGEAVQSVQTLSDSTFLKMMAEKNNLTEALGVSDAVAELMQASYEELMEHTDLELVPVGVLVLGAAVVGAVVIWLILAICLECGKAYQESAEKERLKLHAKLEKKRQVYGNQQAMALWAFEKKFGKEQATVFQRCMNQMHKKGPSLFQDAGLDLDKLKKDLSIKKFKSFKKSLKPRIKLMKSTMTAFMTAHGATLQQEGLAGLGLDSCGRVLCGGDLQFGLDKTGLFHCEWQCPDDFTPAKIESIQLSGEGLSVQELNDMATDLTIAQFDAEKELVNETGTDPTATYSDSKGWSMMKGLRTKTFPALSPDNLKLAKMPNTTSFSMQPPPPIYFRHIGTCEKSEGGYFKTGDTVTFVGDHLILPKGTLVEIAEYSIDFKHRVNVLYGGKRYMVHYEDLRKLVPVSVSKKVQEWLSATGKNVTLQLPAVKGSWGKLLLSQSE